MSVLEIKDNMQIDSMTFQAAILQRSVQYFSKQLSLRPKEHMIDTIAKSIFIPNSDSRIKDADSMIRMVCDYSGASGVLALHKTKGDWIKSKTQAELENAVNRLFLKYKPHIYNYKRFDYSDDYLEELLQLKVKIYKDLVKAFKQTFSFDPPLDLTGAFEENVKSIKKWIRHHPTDRRFLIDVIDLNRCNLATVPIEFLSMFPNLKELYLDHNDLENIPSRIEKLSRLRTLRLDHNKFHNLPYQIGNLTHLFYLYLDHNHLKEIPHQIGNLGKLRTLRIDHNKLRYLPCQIGNLEMLTYLSIDKNKLQSLPAEIDHLDKMNEFYLDPTQLKLLSRVRNLLLKTSPVLIIMD